MKRAFVLEHVEFEGPARIATLLAERGYAIEMRALHRGDDVPFEASAEDLLIVMGGPMGVGDLGTPTYPFLRAEARLLGERLRQDAPVLGICLGAQLLAHAAGARVYPMREAPPASRRYEVGWGSISLHHAGSEALLRGLPAEAPVLHWHGDTFDLPPNAKLLASSKLCQSQAFCLGTRLFGLQFHCEVELAQIDAFLAADGDFVTRANGADGVDRIRDATRVHYEEARRFGDRLLGNLLDAMTEAAPRR